MSKLKNLPTKLSGKRKKLENVRPPKEKKSLANLNPVSLLATPAPKPVCGPVRCPAYLY